MLWIAAVVAAVVLLQTLYFKFTAHPDSVYIFSTLEVEPFGRIMTGVFELITAGFLLWPRTRPLGALAGIGLMSGAIASHLFILGISVHNDHGFLFFLACLVFVACGFILIAERAKLTAFVQSLRARF